MQIVPLLVTFPFGRGWARIMPAWTLFGVSLNPGPFTIKEHVNYRPRQLSCNV